MPISSAFSSAVDSSASGQPGNALPLNMPGGSSDVKVLDYGLMAGFHRPINLVTLSTTGNTIGSSLSGSLIYYDGPAATAGGAFIFTLPDPQPGLWFEFRGLGAVGTSVASIWNAVSATGAFYIGGDSGGADGITTNATTTDGMTQVEFIGISTSKYAVSWKLCSTIPSTGAAGIGYVVSS
jgi:hypothetical protein